MQSISVIPPCAALLRRVLLVLLCIAIAWPAPARAADAHADLPRLINEEEFGRVLALVRPEIANPSFTDDQFLSDVRIVALVALARLAGQGPPDASTDAEVTRLYAEAVRYSGSDEDRTLRARTAAELYYQATGRPGRAMPMLFEDLAHHRRHGDRFAEVTTLTALVSAFTGAGLADQRERYRREAISVLERIYADKPGAPMALPPEFWRTLQSMFLNALSEAADAGDAVRAAKFGPAYLAINDRFLSPRFYGYLTVAEMYAFAGDAGQAQRMLAEGLPIFAAERAGMRDPGDMLRADATLACAQATVEVARPRAEALRLMDACLDGLGRAGVVPSFGTHLQAALVYERAGAADKALAHYQAGIDALGTQRGSYTVAERVAFMNLAVARKLYWGRLRMLVHKARATGSDDAFARAFMAAEEFRARQLGEVVDGDGAGGPPGGVAEFVAGQKPGTLLLGLTVMDDRTVVMAVDGATRRIVETPVGRAALGREVRGLIALLSDRTSKLDVLNRALQAYSARLLGDVRPMLRGRSRIIVALDGPAALIPPALLQAGAANDAPAGLTADVSATPAFRFLARPRPATQAAGLLALGDPAYPDSLSVVAAPPDMTRGPRRDPAPHGRLRATEGGVAVPPLPETRDEVVGIAKLFGGSQRLLLGPEATKAAVKAADLSGVGVLHFATHGLLPGDIPGLTEPALVLAPDAAGDALLRASDVEALDLRSVELTVLSACNTGSGQVTVGEGVMGLSRAFLAAGSRAVIVSMWPVASKETETLMVEFYRMRQTGLTAEQALRAAMATVRRTDPHPSIWAPFVLVRAG